LLLQWNGDCVSLKRTKKANCLKETNDLLRNFATKTLIGNKKDSPVPIFVKSTHADFSLSSVPNNKIKHKLNNSSEDSNTESKIYGSSVWLSETASAKKLKNACKSEENLLHNFQFSGLTTQKLSQLADYLTKSNPDKSLIRFQQRRSRTRFTVGKSKFIINVATVNILSTSTILRRYFFIFILFYFLWKMHAANDMKVQHVL